MLSIAVPFASTKASKPATFLQELSAYFVYEKWGLAPNQIVEEIFVIVTSRAVLRTPRVRTQGNLPTRWLGAVGLEPTEAEAEGFTVGGNSTTNHR